jgi:RNA polymerase sigma-70 factor (ECF subfamily)
MEEVAGFQIALPSIRRGVMKHQGRGSVMSEPPREDALLNLWRAGNQDAARQIFERYVSQLLALASQRISQRLKARVDAEDIVQSVFRTFFHRAREGQFKVDDPDDLCKLLAKITVHKTLRQIAFHKRAKRDATMETAQGDGDSDQMMLILASEPTPEDTVALFDQMDHFLGQLGAEDRRILQMRMEGYSNVEIAEMLNITDRKIRRLLERIRGQAAHEGLEPLPRRTPPAKKDAEPPAENLPT